jgi:hypothetical protein
VLCVAVTGSDLSKKTCIFDRPDLPDSTETSDVFLFVSPNCNWYPYWSLSDEPSVTDPPTSVLPAYVTTSLTLSVHLTRLQARPDILEYIQLEPEDFPNPQVARLSEV